MSGSATRTVYRLVGIEEAVLLRKAAMQVVGKPLVKLARAERVPVSIANPSSNGDFGNLLQEHTMTASRGDAFGKGQPLVPFTEDIEKLAKSTDDAVQNIIRSAPYLVKFEVPWDAVLGAASDLGKAEGEFVGANDPGGSVRF
ncbi:MAG: hypothetical protein ACREFP_18200 [Acetobacteraceae bacterium]